MVCCCPVRGFFTAFIFILCVLLNVTDAAVCYSEQANSSAAINCTASYFVGSNCSETFLSTIYSDLYGQEDFPGGPDNVIVQPIQRKHSNSKYYPGFIIGLKPPKTFDITVVRGFQLNYFDEARGTRCIIIKINGSLNNFHRDNNLTAFTEVYPLGGDRDYIFKAFSLPTPKNDQKEVETRYGTTGKYGWKIDTAAAYWYTTISYYIDTKEKYVYFKFVPGPTEYGFISYRVGLSKILSNEGTNTEKRNTTMSFILQETEHTFRNVSPGRYRIEVSPYDDGTNSTGKCQNEHYNYVVCTKTVTAVLDFPTEETPSPVIPLPTTTSQSTPLDMIKETYETSSNTKDPSTVKSTQTAIVSKNPDRVLLPSVLGVLSAVMVVVIVVCCIWLNKRRMKGIQELFLKKPHHQTPAYLNNNKMDISTLNPPNDVSSLYKQKFVTEKRVAIISAEDGECHRRVVSAFAQYLQKRCHCNVDYFPWTSEDKFRWIANTIQNADFHVFVVTESALKQYEAWKHKQPHSSRDLFVFYLSTVLNRSVSNPNFSQRFMLVKFDYSAEINMPEELSTSQYQLMKHFTGFLSHIHGLNPFKDDLKQVDLPFDDLMKSKEGRDLNNAIQLASKTAKVKQSSRLDSGYRSQTENSFDEQEWREVRQKYVLNELLQEQPKAEVFGVFLIDEESRSLMPGQLNEVVSVAPAVTIAEGGAEEEVNRVNESELQDQHTFICMNKYGSQMVPNICLQASQGNNVKRNTSTSSNESETNFFQQQENNGQLRKGVLDTQDIVFIPPDPSLLDDEILTQYQLETMQNINSASLGIKRQDSSIDNTSGYSV